MNQSVDEDGKQMLRMNGLMASAGTVAILTITCADLGDQPWMLDVFRSLKCSVPEQ